jgi:hypothetical protein
VQLSGSIWVTCCRIYELSFHSINKALSIVEVDNVFFFKFFFDAACGYLNRYDPKQLSKLASDCCTGSGR